MTWVWHGYDLLDEGPDSAWDIALLRLSPGGSDAEVVREFNLKTKKFITPEEGGFYVPEAKSSVGYRTRDEVLIGTDFGEGSMTSSGYPRCCKAWKRGTPLEDAVMVYDTALHEDVSAGQYMYFDRGVWHEFQYRSPTFYTSEQFYRPADPAISAADAPPFKKIPVPDDASVSTFRDAATVTLRTAWAPPGAPEGREFPAGSKLALPMKELMESDFSNLVSLFEPTARTSLENTCGTRNYLILSVLENVKVTLRLWRYKEDGSWSQEEMGAGAVSVGCDMVLRAVWPDESDEVWVTRDG